ncbi:hypothetical protein [Pseudoduganella violacea]|uniref:Uncharacterized protein n=1 Tax=Pseudoduganella violacea TaxID=1715466 RepID=A0A7W5FTJ4_9BURK|nr:hypothetical protein [Pseudoduganella violacea]MBB3118238.1 hypothetical protein [Pseudoduganella violacea]
MLRFPSESLTVVLGRAQVGGLRLRRGAPQLLETLHGDADTAATFTAALELLERWLCANDVRGRRIRLILADSHARYALLPPSAIPLRAAEDAALLGARFGELYGEMAEWQMQAEAQRHGQSRLACAMPAALAQGARALCAQNGCRLLSLQPYFIACWNRWRGRVDGQEGVLAVQAGEELVLAGFGRQGWRSIRASLCEPTPQTLADAIHREKIQHGLAPDLPVWLHAAIHRPDLAQLGQALMPMRPDGGLAASGACLSQAMALAGSGA